MPAGIGRPRKNGRKCSSMLVRAFRVIHEYHQARRDGLKHSSAVQVVAGSLRISATEVRQTLANLQPRRSPVGFFVEKMVSTEMICPEFCAQLGIPEGSTKKNGFKFGFGVRPQYPRANAKDPARRPSPPRD